MRYRVLKIFWSPDVKCPLTRQSDEVFEMQCQCFSKGSWDLDKHILPLADCLGIPTDLTISPQYSGNNRHCNGPYVKNGKGTGGACRSMIRRTS